jgi:hypothetical protein
MAFTANNIAIVYPVDRELGGVPGFIPAVSGQAGNLIPLALPSDLTAGRELYRKLCFRLADSNNGTGAQSIIRKWAEISGQYAYSCLFPVSRKFLNSEITGTEDKYGTGVLKYAVVSTDTQIVVTVRSSNLASGNDAIAKNTYNLSICAADQDPTADGALQVKKTISGTPSVNGVDITITLDSAIGRDFDAGALVQTYPDAVDIATAKSNKVVTSSAGTFDLDAVTLSNVGSCTGQITLTFISATNYNATCDFPGGIVDPAGSSSLGGTQAISAQFQPINRFNSSPVLTIPAAAFGGTFASGDTVTFDVDGAEFCFVEKHVIPAASVSVSGDYEDYALQTASVS